MKLCEMWARAMSGKVVCATANETTCLDGVYYIYISNIYRVADGRAPFPYNKTSMAAVRTIHDGPAPEDTGIATI